MSAFYYNWFYMCYSNEPPTVTEGQLRTAYERGMLDQTEYDQILAIRQEPAPDPEPAPEEPAPEV